jgi:two-component SAPR family response regulator
MRKRNGDQASIWTTIRAEVLFYHIVTRMERNVSKSAILDIINSLFCTHMKH